MNEPLRVTRRQREISNCCVGGRFRIHSERGAAADLLVRASPTEHRAASYGLAGQDLDALHASTGATGPNRKYVQDQLTSDQIDHCRTITIGQCVDHPDVPAAPTSVV